MEKEYINQAVVANLQKIRKRCRITQEKAALYLGISPSKYSRIERGITRVHGDDIAALAKHWGISIAQFYEGIDEEGEQRANEYERQMLKEQNLEMISQINDIETLRAFHSLLRRSLARKRGRS